MAEGTGDWVQATFDDWYMQVEGDRFSAQQTAQEAQRIARMLGLKAGEAVAQGPAAQVLEEKHLSALYGVEVRRGEAGGQPVFVAQTRAEGREPGAA